MYVQSNNEARSGMCIAVEKQVVLLTGLCVRACTLANPACDAYASYSNLICG
jgi:hypothetical protein